MKEAVFALASTFSTKDLLNILRNISSDEKISEYAITTFASALCLGYMDEEDVKEILQKMNEDQVL